MENKIESFEDLFIWQESLQCLHDTKIDYKEKVGFEKQ
jgi:hypothetical protein